MRNAVLIFLLLNLGSHVAIAQNGNHISQLKEIAVLPEKIKETSGLVFFRNYLWTINDSGDGPFIYSFDTAGKAISQIITVKNARNIDWEEITQDEKYFYIGDFGNNLGTRKELTIYRIKKVSIPESGNASVNADSIVFSYNNMEKPGKKPARSQYDCEAMVCCNDTLILFSKNWQRPLCRVYYIPAKPGRYHISPVTTLNIEGLVTGATLSSDKKKLLLIGYKDYSPFIYMIKPFNIKNIKIKRSAYRYYDTRLAQQTEGIAFTSSDEAYISSEMNPAHKNTLFKVVIK
jgi:hypothetical protein